MPFHWVLAFADRKLQLYRFFQNDNNSILGQLQVHCNYQSVFTKHEPKEVFTICCQQKYSVSLLIQNCISNKNPSIANLRKLYNKGFFPWCRQIIQWHAKSISLNLYKMESRWSILKGHCKVYCDCWLLPLDLTLSVVNGVFICVLRAHRGMFLLLYYWFES